MFRPLFGGEILVDIAHRLCEMISALVYEISILLHRAFTDINTSLNTRAGRGPRRSPLALALGSGRTDVHER